MHLNKRAMCGLMLTGVAALTLATGCGSLARKYGPQEPTWSGPFSGYSGGTVNVAVLLEWGDYDEVWRHVSVGNVVVMDAQGKPLPWTVRINDSKYGPYLSLATETEGARESITVEMDMNSFDRKYRVKAVWKSEPNEWKLVSHNIDQRVDGGKGAKAAAEKGGK
jgi:hypothetical protein